MKLLGRMPLTHLNLSALEFFKKTVMKVVNQIKAAAALGLMFLGTAVFAQDDAVYKKQTVTDNSDGTYTLELASFLKGDEVTVLKESSADIVLLLDYTGTMLGTVRVPHYFQQHPQRECGTFC